MRYFILVTPSNIPVVTLNKNKKNVSEIKTEKKNVGSGGDADDKIDGGKKTQKIMLLWMS